MKTLQLVDKETFQFVEVEMPLVGHSDVLLRIRRVGICGTDIHRYHEGEKSVPFPLILGHEFVGDVVDVGSSVTRITIGDRAVAEHVVGCGQCYACKEGRYNICVNPAVYGLHKPGALAEYMLVPETLVYQIPTEISYDQALFIEPLSIAVYAAQQANLSTRKTVCVIGQGPLGLLLDQMLTSRGIRVIGVDVLDNRIAFAKNSKFIDLGLNLEQSDFDEALSIFTSTDGIDCVFEAVGKETTINLGISLVRSGGSVIVLGVFDHPIPVRMMSVVRRELRLCGVSRSLGCFDEAITLLQKRSVFVDTFITHRYDFSEAPRAFIDASSYNENRIKSIIEFN